MTVASEDDVSLAGCSRWCAETLVYPCPRSCPRPFLEWLIATLSTAPDTVLFTAGDVTTSIVGKSRLSLPPTARAILPPQRSLELALDKSATIDLAPQLGVPIPKSVAFDRKEPIDVSRHTRFLPTTKCLAAYREWAGDYPSLFAIGGLDMHVGNEWGCEVALDRACELTSDAVLARIRAGEFVTKGRFLSFGSRPAGGIRGLAFAAGDALAGARSVRNRVLSP